LFWRIRSRAKNKGRPKTDAELRRLIQCILCRYRHKMHWAECRRFSLPEFKRFGSFPDGFTFAGEFPEGIRQIGNCVPPLFMRAIARHIRFEMLPVARRQDAAA
jgi:site-specific DNA-cytosine methylase